MQRRQNKSVANLSTVSEASLLEPTDLEPEDFPTKVVMRKLKWYNDPRFRLNLQQLHQPSRPRPPTQGKEKLVDKRNVGSVAGKRPARLGSLAGLHSKLIPKQVTRLPGAGLMRPPLGATLAHLPKSLTPLKASGMLDVTLQNIGRFPSRLRVKS
jgi:hypothetical protein